MAEVNDVFDSVTKEQSFFIPGNKEKKEFKPYAKGEYFGHIIECDSRVVDVKKGEHKARLYTFVFQAAQENETKTFEFKNIKGEMEKTKGDCYVGAKFRGKLWRFLEPGKDDTFTSNSEGNTGYMRFCQTIGVKCPVEKREINGEEIEVQLLPNLSASDMLGKPAIAVVDLGRPFVNKDGETKQYWDAKFLKKWEEGKQKTVSGADDAIPF
jgi:hypothetical protein